MKKTYLPFVLLLLFISCEKSDPVDGLTPLENSYQSQFDKSVFKGIIPYSYDVDWSNPNEQYSEELNTHFYEFDLIYKTPFNPTNVNKTKKQGYNTAYKLVVTKDNENEFSFFMAKFYQEKDGQQNIEELDVSFNKNTGYRGITRLYDSANTLVLAKVVDTEESNVENTHFTREGLKTLGLTTLGTIKKCKTSTTYHYIDWYRYTYDIYGNLISIEYLYTEYVGSSQSKTCTTETIPDEPVRKISGPPFLVPCNDGSGRTDCANEITEGIECQEGFRADENNNCVEIEELKEDFIEDEKIINELVDKALCVYEKLQELSGGFKNMIKKFDGEFPVSHLKFDMGDIGASRGRTIAPNNNPTTPNSPDFVIIIRLNNNSTNSGVAKRPNLLVAKTIAHEVIHAEMYRKLLSVLDNGGNFDGVTRQDVLDALNGNYPGLYDYYRRHKNWQHAQMAQHYRETLARMLQEYDTGLIVPNSQQPQQLYMDLAWEGLIYENPPNAIPTWTNLPQTERDRVEDVIADYIEDNKNETCTE